MHDLGALWASVFEENLLDNIPNKTSADIIAVYYDYEGDYTEPYTYILGVPVSTLENLPQGITGISIPAQTYEVFTAKGKMPGALIETWQTIWRQPLRRNYRFDLEVYGEKSFSVQPEVKIWIGVDEA